MKISCIMPVYNTPIKYLKESIESILNQSYTDFEFIIINDGSQDKAIEDCILSYKDKRIKYINQENQGVGQTLNNGLAIAQGEYIARMDADDISFLNRFEIQVRFLQENPQISLCGTNLYELRRGKSTLVKLIEEPRIFDIINKCPIAHNSIMFRRVDFDKYDLKYNPNFKCEDYELWSRALKYLKFYNIQEPLVIYRKHDSNVSSISKGFSQDVAQVRENIIDFLTTDKKMKTKIQSFYQKSIWKKLFSLYNEEDKKVLEICTLKFTLCKRRKRG